jgi:mRNA-degrading endonuclease toxin of MazEF toxin-antitoxin module
MANLAQILTVDKARLQRRLGMLSRERMDAVDAAIMVSPDVG